jgi:hypothetical protein
MPAQYNMLSNVRSFMKSRVILTAAELDLFTKKVKMVMQGERMDCL